MSRSRDVIEKAAQRGGGRSEVHTVELAPGRGSPLARPKRVYVVPEPRIEFVRRFPAGSGRECALPEIPVARQNAPPNRRTVKTAKGIVHRIDAQREWRYRVWASVWGMSTLTFEQAHTLVHGIECSKNPAEHERISSELPTRTVTFYIDYPLDHAARVTVKPFTRKIGNGRGSITRMSLGYLLWQAARAYVKVYREHKRYGVWGHHINDLQFESLHLRDNVAEFWIRSGR